MRRWAPVLLVGLLAAVFAWLNRGETSILRLGFANLYRVPTTLVVLGAFILGMAVMFLLGLRHDLKVRRTLRREGLLDAPREPAAPLPENDYTAAYPRWDESEEV